MNIWILQTGEPLHIDKGNHRPMRAMNLSNKLVEAGHSVILWSSAFSHQGKKHRTKEYSIYKVNDNLEVRLIPSCGYQKHIGLGRLFDHFQLALNLKKVLKKEKSIPDVGFIGYPPIETAAVMSRWLKKRGVPIILDVKDLWPLMFVDAFPKLLRPIARVIFHPYFYFAKRTMRDVDGISTMSRSFLNRSLSFANKSASAGDKIVRLTTLNSKSNNKELNSASEFWKKFNVKPSTPKVFFTGTFSTAFDFDQIRVAAEKVVDCQFILCGHGPCLNEVQNLMKGLPNVIFPGWIDKFQMESLANMSIASLAPYKNIENFTLNIPNKIVDSLSLGSPILSFLKGEVSTLIENNAVGFTYGSDRLLSDCIQSFLDNNDLQKQMSINAKNLYRREFEFNKVYNSLVFHLEKMAVKN
jgi:glycosyltransferase involved in cell wall biosynthesis